MRILVTGPRDWTNGVLVAARLIQVSGAQQGSGVTLIEGGARGFDSLASTSAELFGWTVETYEPDYTRHKGYAPFARNQQMVDTGANVCVAGYLPCIKPNCKRPTPHGTHGTADCVSRAREAGIAMSTIHGVRK